MFYTKLRFLKPVLHFFCVSIKMCIFDKIIFVKKLYLLLLFLFIGILFSQCQTKIKNSLRIGDTVPDFSLLDQNGALFKLKNLKGQSLVIYFYPKDDTPGCTREACKFRDEFEVFSDLNTRVIGISSDDVRSHKEFEIKYNLPFTLLADTDQKVRKLFGVPSFGAGLIPGRVTYIIDKKGIVRHVFNNMRQAEMHVDKSVEIIKTFK